MDHNDLPKNVIEILRLFKAGCDSSDQLNHYHFEAFYEGPLDKFKLDYPDFPWINEKDLII